MIMNLVICHSINQTQLCIHKSRNSLSSLIDRNCDEKFCDYILRASLNGKQMRRQFEIPPRASSAVKASSQSQTKSIVSIYTFIVVPEASFVLKRIQLSHEFNCCAFPSAQENLSLNLSGDLCNDDEVHAPGAFMAFQLI